MNKEILLSSNNMNWETPKNIIELAKSIVGIDQFTLDCCAKDSSVAKGSYYFSPEDDGLKQKWYGTVWNNPPYGRNIIKWIKKSYEESLTGVEVICLIPARTDTVYFHDYCAKFAQVYLIKGRITFEINKSPVCDKNGHPMPAPFPSMFVHFKNGLEPKIKVISQL